MKTTCKLSPIPRTLGVGMAAAALALVAVAAQTPVASAGQSALGGYPQAGNLDGSVETQTGIEAFYDEIDRLVGEKRGADAKPARDQSATSTTAVPRQGGQK